MEKSILEGRLQKARKRLADCEFLLKESEDMAAYAKQRRLPQVEKDSTASAVRHRKNHSLIKALVEELEKASGALPLK